MRPYERKSRRKQIEFLTKSFKNSPILFPKSDRLFLCVYLWSNKLLSYLFDDQSPVSP